MSYNLSLLHHASHCNNPYCQNVNCLKMKDLMNHYATCPIGNMSCARCRKIIILTNIHARHCHDNNCKVPQCQSLKCWIRKLNEAKDGNVNAQYELGYYFQYGNWLQKT